MKEGKKHFETICVHGCHEIPENIRPISPPIYQSSTFYFSSAEQGADIFLGNESGYIYTRLGNPTHRMLEKTIAELEYGEDAVVFSSGMAAIASVVMHLTRAGQNIVSSHTIYGGTHLLFRDSLPAWGIEVREVDASDPDRFEKAIDSDTSLVYIETPANPTLSIIDIKQFAEIAHRKQLPLIVDNTFATPYFQNPISLGADIVVHSATKYLSGHGDTIAGVVVGKQELITPLRKRTLRDLGGSISPFDAWLVMRGIKTLAVRMERHQYNACKLAAFLENHPKVNWVRYPGLASHPEHELAKRQMRGFGAMIAFEVAGGRSGGIRLLNHLRLIRIAVSLGDCDSLIQHPASMTHSQYTERELIQAGITEGMIRFSVGIEHVDDLLNDLDQALKAV